MLPPASSSDMEISYSYGKAQKVRSAKISSDRRFAAFEQRNFPRTREITAHKKLREIEFNIITRYHKSLAYARCM